MVHTTDINGLQLKLSAKLPDAQELETMSAVSTDVPSDCNSSIHFSEEDRKREKYIRSRDKMIFCLNFINMIVTTFLLAKAPIYFAYWNAIMLPILLLHRVYDFYQKGWQFYMIDFCYIVNLMVIAHTIFFPKNEMMFMISFALSVGPLTFSIYYFRNSLAFISMEKITSFAIHSQASLTMFLVHWHDHSGHFLTSAEGLREFGLAFIAKWFISIIIFYGIWALVYTSMIFLVFGAHISRKKLQTLYSYSMADPRTAKRLLAHGPRWSKALFMFQHFRMVVVFAALAMVFYYNYWMGLLWLLGNHLVAIYNGATYWIDYHSNRYEKQFICKSKSF